MAGITEIRTRIDSVQQTLKITNAMYLISSSKLRKARQQLAHVQPFYERIRETIADILHRSDEMQHVYFDKREKVAEHKVGYIVISGDKGLAGAYNHNILHLTEEQMAQHPNSMLFVVGQMGRSYFSGKNINLDRDFLFAAQDPTLSRADDICEVCIQNFRDETLDEIYVIYTEMVTPLRLETRIQKLLPLDIDSFSWAPKPGEEALGNRKVTYVPSQEQVLNHLVPGYVQGILFGALVESFCAEQNARMTAMDSSSTNAREMLKDLSLRYNRARQAAITQEITEIVGGAQRKDDDGPPRPKLNPTRTVRFSADGNRIDNQ